MELKRVFWISFSRVIYRGIIFCEYYTNLPAFCSHFLEILPKIVNNSTVDFFKKTKKFFWLFWFYFLAKILAKCFEIQPFSSKIALNKLFLVHFDQIYRKYTTKTINTIFLYCKVS